MDEVEKLRKQLRDGRDEESRTRLVESGNAPERSDAPRTHSASHVVEQYTPTLRGQDQRRSEPAERRLHGNKGIVGAVGNIERKSDNGSGSNSPDSVGTRPFAGRSGEDHGTHRTDGTDVPTGTTGRKRRVGNLETTEPIPPRLFKDEEETTTNPSAVAFDGIGQTAQRRGRGRPPKPKSQETHQPVPTQTIGAGPERKPYLQNKTLTKAEAKDLEEPLLHALTKEFELLDKAIWSYAKDIPQGQLEQPIWSNVAEDDMQSLVNILLKMGQKSPAAATMTRVAVDGSDYVTVGLMFAPRFNSTVQIVRSARQKKQQEKAAGNANTPTRRARLQALRKSTERYS